MTATVIKLRNARQRRRELLKTFCQCLGLASIVLVMNYGALLGGGAEVRMHVPFSLVGICMAQLTDIFLLALLLFAILVPLQNTRAYPVVRLLVAILVPPYVLFRLQDLIPFASQDGLITVVFVVWGGLLLVLYLRYHQWFRKLVRLGDALSIFLFLFAVCGIAQILFVTLWKPGPYQRVASWENANQPPRQHARIVWIVFDELSYDQTFGHRAHDLELPNFDKLRSESTLYTNVQPIGNKTVKIIPSLLTGHVVDDVRFGFNNGFKAHYVGVHGWHPLDGKQTVFADAQREGWRTAVVGWYNPYCTIYAGAIDDCYWMNHDRVDGDMAQQDGFWRNVYSPLASMVREVKAPERDDRDSCTYDVRQRLKSDLDLEQHVQQELQTDQSDFVFLHLPVPHSPNIWSREEDNYTTFCDSSYLDNLALADRILGHVMDQLQASPRWKDTTVIVQGDHSWRMYLWNYLPAWTSEDDAISRGGFDPHPAMLIHRAGQTTAATDSSAWSVVNVHEVLEQILSSGR
jgi:arylsulfatase A-like enzyme